MGEAAHEFVQGVSAGDEFAEVENFAPGEFFPARADGSRFANAAEEDADVVEREAHFAGETNEKNAVESFRRVATLAACAGRGGKKADFFVIAGGGRGGGGLLGESGEFD